MNALSLVPEHPEFSEEEEHTGIHVLPTPSMPPVSADDAATTAISSTIAAILAESEAEEKIEDLTGAAEEERDEVMVAQASLPPAAESSVAPPAPSRSRSRHGLRFGGIALTIIALGFGAGFVFTRPAEAPAPATEAAKTTETRNQAKAAKATEAADVVAVPTVSIAAAAPEAPPAVKPPPTLADANWMLNQNNLARAEQIYQSILASGGSDHEALTGLGKVALRRGQDKDAIAFFERAVARQPQYFPARLGIADALWNSGRKDSAKARYAALREGYADNMIPARVVERTR